MVLSRWEHAAPGEDVFTRYSDVLTGGADSDATVICGPHDSAPSTLFLLRSCGHELFAVSFNAEVPVLETVIGPGQVVAGMTVAPIPA